MIEHPNQEIIFMTLVSYMSETTGLYADKYYSIENQNKKDIVPMTQNENYDKGLIILKSILDKKENKIDELKDFLLSINKNLHITNKNYDCDLWSIKNCDEFFCYLRNNYCK